MFEINGYILEGGGACPEQYMVYKDDEEVGYLRLRHGYFRAEYNNRIVFEAYPKGDGIFESGERMHFLTKAIEAIHEANQNEW